MRINKLLTPCNFKESTIDRIKYIVIHYVGATGGAEANCKYYADKYLGASAHYFVGHKGEIWQSVEDKNIAWHCGGSKYANTEGGTFHGLCTNANSIGIEMCVRNNGNHADYSADWYFEDATVAATIELTKELMEKYNIPAERVIRHYDVTGKICPNPFVLNDDKHTWSQFKAAITRSQEEGWVHDATGWWYRNSDGTWPANEWKVINHHWYLFGADGYMLTGWQKKNDRWYYLEESGKFEGACWHGIADNDGSMERWYVE